MSAAVIVFAMFVSGWAYVGGFISGWDRQAETSLSLRNPRQQYRISASGDSIHNDTDYQIGWGLTQTRGPWSQRHHFEWERQDGLHYFDHENFLERRGDRIIVGISEENSQEDGYYKLGMWSELRFGIIGLGVSRNYTRWVTEDPATMFRMSLTSDQEFGPVVLSTHAVYEVNPSRQNADIRIEMHGMRSGRVEIVPFFQWKRVEPKRGPHVDSWMGKAVLTVDLN